MKAGAAILFLISSAAFATGTRVSCDFATYGAPFATVSFDQFADGSYGIAATITQYGRSHEELIAPVARAVGEKAHVLISPETQNELEMIVTEQPQAQGQARLINHNVPVGKEMWGGCGFSPLP